MYENVLRPRYLRKNYVILKKTTYEIASEVGCVPITVNRYLREFGIPLRTTTEYKVGKCLSEEHKRKISMTRITRGLAKGINNPMFGKTHTPATKEKISKSHKGQMLSK